jgi:acylphosphatase
MMEEIHAKVTGLVQGVGFRSLVSRYALEHNIKGFVRNLPDGTVEICAQGAAVALKEFFNEIRKSPGRASIERLEEKKTECGIKHSSFRVY